ncbi:hypothetical protein [Scytonema sp. HK-05]|nr:hypothetical protein [Scytonema sp. HK-05]
MPTRSVRLRLRQATAAQFAVPHVRRHTSTYGGKATVGAGSVFTVYWL